MAKPTPQEATAAREARLTELRAKLEDAVEELTSGEDWMQAIRFAASFRSRSFGNTLLIYVQHSDAHAQGRVPEPSPTCVAGFRQWRQLGRSVDKGQSGYMIFAPVTARFATTNPREVDSWRRLDRGERPRPGEVVRSKIVNVRPAYVWDVSQTSGEPIPGPPRPNLLQGHAPAGLWEGLTAQAERAGYTVTRVPDSAVIDGANGLTDTAGKTIHVRTDCLAPG